MSNDENMKLLGTNTKLFDIFLEGMRRKSPCVSDMICEWWN